MSCVFIHILMIRTLDPVTISNLKRWLQRANLLRAQVAQATTQTQVEQNLLVYLMGRKSRVAVERRVKNMQR